MTAAAAKSLQSCPTLCDPKDGSPPGSPVPGILQPRTLEWVAISFSNAWKWKVKVKSESEVAQLCPTLSDLTDCSLPGSSIHGIFQARVLEWGAIAVYMIVEIQGSSKSQVYNKNCIYINGLFLFSSDSEHILRELEGCVWDKFTKTDSVVHLKAVWGNLGEHLR